MEAFRKNTSLLNIAFSGEEEFFNALDHVELRRIAARNRFLQSWLADPGASSVPLNIVPIASRACADSGDYSALFQSLRHNTQGLVDAFRRQRPLIDDVDDVVPPASNDDSPPNDHNDPAVQQLQNENRIQREQIAELQQQVSTLQEQVSVLLSNQFATSRNEANESGDNDASSNKRRRI